MMPLDLRDSTPDDLPAITGIYAHAVSHTSANYELDPPDLDEMTRRWRTVVDAGYPFLVALHEGSVVGYAYASPYRTRPAYRYTVENSIYVAPAQQGRGVGRALLGALLARCEAQGYRLMVAIVGDTANTASIRLHEAAGFSLVGVMPGIGYKHDRWLDSVVLTRPLGPGKAAPPDR